jgi:ParB-like chromosome segregation protein Spo0J
MTGIKQTITRFRVVDINAEVQKLAISMQQSGMLAPITVRYRYHDDIPSSNCEDGYELIFGHHRLVAAKLLGWENINAIEVECSDVDAKLMEIAENLHRAELTRLQHDEQVAEWIRLTNEKEVSAQVAPKPKGGRPAGGVRAAARDLGVDRDAANRAIKVASLSDEAKVAAREHGLDDNRTALLEAARETEPAAQVAAIVERATRTHAAAEAPETTPEAESEPEIESINTMSKSEKKNIAALKAKLAEADGQLKQSRATIKQLNHDYWNVVLERNWLRKNPLSHFRSWWTITATGDERDGIKQIIETEAAPQINDADKQRENEAKYKAIAKTIIDRFSTDDIRFLLNDVWGQCCCGNCLSQVFNETEAGQNAPAPQRLLETEAHG